MAAALLSTVDSWRRTARLLAYGDVRHAAGLVATVGKLLQRLSLPLPPGRHGADEESEDEVGRSRPLWVPLGLPEEMLVWLAWPWKAGGTGGGGTGGGDGSETQEEGSPAASAPSLKLLDLVSLAVPRWLPHVAMLALAVDGRLVHASERAAWVTLLWVPPLTHAYARAVDTGDDAAAAAWRGLLLHDMSVLAVLERQLQGLMRSLVMEFRQPGVACKRSSCKWVTRRWEMELGFELADDGRALHGARLVRRGMVRRAGEDGEVEEFKDSCMYCCHALACALWAMHCVAAALPEEVGEHLKRTNGRLLRGLVTRVTGPDGVAPRPRLQELLDRLAGGRGGGSSSGTGSGSCGGSSSSGGGNGAVGGGFGAGGGSLAACVPDPRVWGGTRASMVAQQLLPPHTAGQQLGVRVCGNPRCDELGGDSEVDVPLPYVCVHCKGMWYCGRGCMVAHWRAGGHKEVCEAGRGRGVKVVAAEGPGGVLQVFSWQWDSGLVCCRCGAGVRHAGPVIVICRHCGWYATVRQSG